MHDRIVTYSETECPDCGGTKVQCDPTWPIVEHQIAVANPPHVPPHLLCTAQDARRLRLMRRFGYTEEIPPLEQPCAACGGTGIKREEITLAEALAEMEMEY